MVIESQKCIIKDYMFEIRRCFLVNNVFRTGYKLLILYIKFLRTFLILVRLLNLKLLCNLKTLN